MKKFLEFAAATAVVSATSAAHGEVVWSKLPGCVTSITGGYAIGCGAGPDNGIFMYHPNIPWYQVAGGAVKVTSDINGNPWVVNSQGNVYVSTDGFDFSLFQQSQGVPFTAVAVGDPSVVGDIWAVDAAGNVYFNYGTQSHPGPWEGGAPGECPSACLEPAWGIAVFTGVPGVGCGAHRPFYVGISGQIYEMTGGNCFNPIWSPVPGVAGFDGDTVDSIANNGLVVGTDGNIYVWDPWTGTFPFWGYGVPGGSVGLGSGPGNGLGIGGIYSFDANGTPYQATFPNGPR